MKLEIEFENQEDLRKKIKFFITICNTKYKTVLHSRRN